MLVMHAISGYVEMKVSRSGLQLLKKLATPLACINTVEMVHAGF